MKNRLPNLALLSVGLVVACWPTVGAGQGTPVNPLAPAPNQTLVGQAARRILAESGLEAKIRQRVFLGRHELMGVGLYQQLGNGPDKMIRWEMKTQLDEQTVTLQQIAGDRYFWIRKDLPQDRKQLSRVSLWQFRDAVRRVGVNNPDHAANCWLLLGGLSRLLIELDRNFTFAEPKEGTLAGVPVWILEGDWKPEARAGLDIAPDRNPEHFPTRVVLTLGRDNILPLFPYRVEYLRPQGGAGSTDLQPVMTMELYEARRRTDLEPRSFEYNPGDQEVEDVTRAYMLRLGLGAGG